MTATFDVCFHPTGICRLRSAGGGTLEDRFEFCLSEELYNPGKGWGVRDPGWLLFSSYYHIARAPFTRLGASLFSTHFDVVSPAPESIVASDAAFWRALASCGGPTGTLGRAGVCRLLQRPHRRPCYHIYFTGPGGRKEFSVYHGRGMEEVVHFSRDVFGDLFDVVVPPGGIPEVLKKGSHGEV